MLSDVPRRKSQNRNFRKPVQRESIRQNWESSKREVPAIRLTASCAKNALPQPSNTHVLRVGLIDPDKNVHEFVGKAIRTLAPDWSIAKYAMAEEALRMIPESPPDVVLMEIDVPPLSGVECARRLTSLVSGLPIVMLANRSDEQAILFSVRAGACGYLIKPASAEEVVRTVLQAAQGWPVLCLEAAKALLDSIQRTGRYTSGHRLTSREEEVLALLIKHSSDKEVAHILNIAPATVHAHVAHLSRKLGAHGRGDAIAKFLGAG
jgi:DNA-binding NarL/FixJ family response regulator